MLAQDIGTETTIQFARRHDVLCRTVNVLAPAVELREATNPASDDGRFDVLVDGSVVASGANGTVAGPVGVGDGRVTVSERGAGGTRLHDYDSSIQCRSRSGVGPVVSTTHRTAASFMVSGRQIVGCTVLNVRKDVAPGPPPAPSPAPHPAPPAPLPGPVPPTNVDLVTQASAVRDTVPVGASAQFRIRVTNRGPLPATNLNIAASLPPRLAERAVSIQMPGGAHGGPCVTVPRGGACQVPRLLPGRSVELQLQVTAHQAHLITVKAVATAEQPDLAPGNNDADATITVEPQPPPAGRG